MVIKRVQVKDTALVSIWTVRIPSMVWRACVMQVHQKNLWFFFMVHLCLCDARFLYFIFTNLDFLCLFTFLGQRETINDDHIVTPTHVAHNTNTWCLTLTGWRWIFEWQTSVRVCVSVCVCVCVSYGINLFFFEATHSTFIAMWRVKICILWKPWQLR